MNKYIIIDPQGYCGMCGYLWQTIRAIYHNPNKLYYIDFSTSIYKTKNENVWDYFFEQPHTTNKPLPDQIEKKVGIIFDQESEFVWRNIQPNTIEEIQKRRHAFSEIIKKYMVLKPDIQNKIDNFVNKNFKNKKILGVHFRGTDHPNPLHSPFYETRFPRNGSFEYQYKIAEDVIIEAFLMSKVDYLLCCEASNVNYLARAINPTLKALEVSDKISI
jgi:hypothetical protein